MFKKLIVGVDFSDTSRRAAETAVALASSLGAEVVLVHVVAPGPDYVDPARLVPELRPAIEASLRHFIAQLRVPKNVNIDWGVVDGDPARELVTFADRWNGDLIVIGTAGRSGLPRMVLGSVASRLVRMAKVPVLVVGPESAQPFSQTTASIQHTPQ